MKHCGRINNTGIRHIFQNIAYLLNYGNYNVDFSNLIYVETSTQKLPPCYNSTAEYKCPVDSINLDSSINDDQYFFRV